MTYNGEILHYIAKQRKVLYFRLNTLQETGSVTSSAPSRTIVIFVLKIDKIMHAARF